MSSSKRWFGGPLARAAWVFSSALLIAAFMGCGGGTDGPSAAAGAPSVGTGGTGGASGASSPGGASGAGMAGTAGTAFGSGGSVAGTSGTISVAGAGGLNAGGSASGGAGGSGSSSGAAGQGGTSGSSVAGGTGGAHLAGGSSGGGAGSSMGGVSGGGAAGNGAGALKAAMVVQTSGTPTAGDQVMVSRLSARGIQTKFLADTVATAAAVNGLDLVVISSSAESGPLGNKLRDIAIPVLCIENGEYPLMALTGATLNTHYGQITGQSKVQLVAGSALVGSLSGTVTISNVAGDFGWGIPGAAALKGATVAGNAGQAALFGYEKGAQMVGMVAPARRAAFAIRESMAANLSPDGKALFDALLDWVLK